MQGDYRLESESKGSRGILFELELRWSGGSMVRHITPDL
jgi:hypothetical protein